MADDGALDSPRASVFGPRSLCHLAHELAQVSSVVPGRIRYAIPREVAQLRSRLERAYARIAEAQAAERAITPAAQWLLDNFHVVGENLGALPGLLPREPIAALPLITTPASTGPDGGTGIGIRIRDLLRHFAAHVDNRFQPEVLTGFLQAYQAIRPLTMGELWAVPSFFRLTILETLADIAEGTVRALDGRLAADALADAVLGEHASSAGDPGTGVRLPESGLNLPFVVQLVERLRYRSEDALEIVDRISQRVASEGLTIDECVRREHHRQSANNASVAHIIGSLREIDAVDWRDIFSELSVVERLLEGVASYAQVDQATRERYRHVIADLAARSGRPESDIAARARDAARAWPDQKAREADIGWHLVDEGRPQLEEAIGYRPSPAVWLRRAVKRNPLPTYLCPIALLTALILGWAVTQGMVDPGTGELALMIVLGAFPASDLAVRLVNLAASRLVPARPRPRLDLHKGAPAEAKTLVVMPVMLTTRTAIDEHCERLEVHYLSNPDPAFRFALLSDWVDSDSESTGEDGELLAHAQEAIARLNDRYPAGFADPRFHLFHRRRTWSVGEDCWMGWERKRGKLLELNNLLLHGRPGNFIVPAPGDPVVPRDVRFVLTLDGDTRLPIGAVRRLLETALHPLNTPRRDSPGQVTAGYGVLQPRVTPLLPDEAGQSLFQWAATGASGMDPYAGAAPGRACPRSTAS